MTLRRLALKLLIDTLSKEKFKKNLKYGWGLYVYSKWSNGWFTNGTMVKVIIIYKEQQCLSPLEDSFYGEQELKNMATQDTALKAIISEHKIYIEMAWYWCNNGHLAK